MTPYLEELQRLYRVRRLIPFIGAGISASVKWEKDGEQRHGLTWSELVDQAAKQLGFTDPALLRIRGTDLQILEYFKIKKGGEFASLTNWLYAEMRPPDSAIRDSPIYRALANLAECSTYYTTNYDDFLERGLALNGRKFRSVATEIDMGARLLESATDTADVVKFHGDFMHPQQMVISELDYERRLLLSTAMDYRLRADVLGRALLFIGYSFHDSNISYLFGRVNEEFGRLPESFMGKRAYITVADPSDFELQLFNARNIGVIALRGGHREADIETLLRSIGSN